jgi:Ni,Fe-hydrogenase III component G
MNTDTTLKIANDLLTNWTIETAAPEANRIDVVIDDANLLAAVNALAGSHWGYLAGITGLDLGVEAGQIEVLYHFCSGKAVVTLRVRTPRDHADVPSIAAILPSANFYERELHEMLGVEVIDLANLNHLFLPDDWPDGVYPLRKDAILT